MELEGYLVECVGGPWCGRYVFLGGSANWEIVLPAPFQPASFVLPDEPTEPGIAGSYRLARTQQLQLVAAWCPA